MKVRILAIGDVVGKPGRSIIINRVGEYLGHLDPSVMIDVDRAIHRSLGLVD